MENGNHDNSTGATQPHTSNLPATTGEGAAVPALLDPKALKELGLKPDDINEIVALSRSIHAGDPTSVSEFGREVAEHTSRYADELLNQVKNKDLDEAGAKLSQVMVIARGLNMHALSDQRSRIPVIGPLIDKVRLRAGTFMGQFETTKTQIDGLVAEVEQTQKGLGARNVVMGQMFDAVMQEHRLLGLHIAAGQIRLEELRELAAQKRILAESPSEVQELVDLDALVSNLDIRIGNLRALQQSAMQTLPQIRLVQSSNVALVDKFHTIKEITVPAWKRQFMLQLGLNEQRNAVQLANTIDDTTNDLLRQNAELLHRNSVETAKSNQRLVIDIETLEHVQKTLIKTVEDVIKAQEEGVQKRLAAVKQIEGMRADLRNRLTRTGVKEIA